MSESTRKILCIDDEPTQLIIFSQVLAQEGFEVMVATSAEEGLNYCIANRYDAVLTDYQMPSLNGIEFLISLKQFDDAPPVVILTGRGSEEVAVQAMKLGAMDYIVKDERQGYLKLLGVTLHRAIELHEARRAKEKLIAEQAKLLNELQTALANVKRLSGLVPICSSCKKIRDDKGYWNQLEAYLQENLQLNFTHGICPECVAMLYPQKSKPTTNQSDLVNRPSDDRPLGNTPST
ncbi:MAG: response regulator [Chloroherpetonaceae bacterium]